MVRWWREWYGRARIPLEMDEGEYIETLFLSW